MMTHRWDKVQTARLAADTFLSSRIQSTLSRLLHHALAHLRENKLDAIHFLLKFMPFLVKRPKVLTPSVRGRNGK